MNWIAQDMNDQSGKTAILTGANSGLGLETVRALAAKGATVIMACRSLEKAEVAKRDILNTSPNANLEMMQLDLANLSSVHEFARMFTAQHQRLDILVNNAGVMGLPMSKTSDGFETHFAANHLGHFALVGLLLGSLRKTPKARVVVVGSAVERQAQMNFENLNGEQQYNPLAAYGTSKLANMLFCYELGRRFKQSGIDALATAAHPGWTASNLQQNSPAFRFLNPIFSQNATQGALPILYAATAPDVQNGEFFGPSGFLEMKGSPKRVKSSRASHDLELAKKLWNISEAMTNIKYAW